MISSRNNFQFKSWTLERTNSYTKSREGELKIGEELGALNDSKYVILGIKESIGPEANLGNPGAENGFDAFCSKFFNLQSNRFLNGSDIAFLGEVSVTNVFHEPEYRLAVEELDAFVTKVLTDHLRSDQIPIVIGGGHNNAYPIIQFVSEKYKNKINVVNLDAHADYRKLEGRHSGNPFSYAYKYGFIETYRIIGLHQSYNSEENLERLKNDGHEYVFMEDFLDGTTNWLNCINQTKEVVLYENRPTGIELDLDVIQMMPSSASSPFGCDLNQARQYIRVLAKLECVKYLHLPEGAPSNDKEVNQIGKTLALLVADFISANKKQSI